MPGATAVCCCCKQQLILPWQHQVCFASRHAAGLALHAFRLDFFQTRLCPSAAACSLCAVCMQVLATADGAVGGWVECHLSSYMYARSVHASTFHCYAFYLRIFHLAPRCSCVCFTHAPCCCKSTKGVHCEAPQGVTQHVWTGLAAAACCQCSRPQDATNAAAVLTMLQLTFMSPAHFVHVRSHSSMSRANSALTRQFSSTLQQQKTLQMPRQRSKCHAIPEMMVSPCACN